jgi:hypothetical protein
LPEVEAGGDADKDAKLAKSHRIANSLALFPICCADYLLRYLAGNQPPRKRMILISKIALDR